MTADRKGELRQRLERAETALEALQDEEVDAIVGKKGIALLRLREVDEKLRASERRYRQLFENMSEGFALHEIVTDPDGRPCDYRFLDINPAFERLTGLKRADVLGRLVRDVLPGVEPHWIENFGRVALTGEPTHFDEYAAELGRWYEVFAYQPAPLQFAVIFTDASERRRVQDELSRQRELLQRIFDSIPVLLVKWNPQLRRFTLNRHVESVLGWTSDDANAGDFMSKVYPDAATRERVAAFMRALEPGWREWETATKDGRRVPIEWANVRLSDDTMIGIGVDLREQKRAEAALRESEERLRQAMIAGRVFTFEWEPRLSRIRRSPNCVSTLGLDPKAPTCASDWEYFQRVHPRDRDAFVGMMRGLSPETPEYETEYRYMRDDGRTIWLEESGRGEFDENGELIRLCGIAADVTARIEAEEREKEAAAAATAAQAAIDTVNAMGEGVALLHMDGHIRDANPAFCALTEYDVSALRGMQIRELLPDIFDADSETVRRTIAQVRLKTSKTDTGDALSATTRSGGRKWVIPTLSTIHSGSRPVGIVLTLRDVTAMIRMQVERSESEKRYRELVENANSIIMRITPDHRIVFFNEYAQRFFGYTAEEIAGRNVIGTITPEIDSEGRDLRAMTSAITEHPELHGSNDNENMCKDGRRVWVHWSNRAIRDEQGDVTEILCVGTDITERKRLEREAEAYRRRLRGLADRLTATEEQERRRVSTQIHDTVIQTLSLSNIRLGGIRRALEAAGLADTCEKMDGVRTLIDNGIGECRGLMADLTPPLLYELGLGSALKAFAEKQSRLHAVEIAVDTGDDERLAELDDARRSLLFQAARELVTNALKHAGPCTIDLRIACADGLVRLDVRDTGRGFPAGAWDNPRATYDEGGFGLFNIRERLENIGGRIEIDTAPGQGSRMVVHLPVGS